MTVKELLESLKDMPEDAPVFVGTGYDGNTELTSYFGVEYTYVHQIDKNFWSWSDPEDWGEEAIEGVVIA